MKVREVADLVGISVRTLHYYDEIGLLKPEKITASGYREYSEKNLETLQQILFFKELGFPLKRIKEIINNPLFDRQKALEVQHKMLLNRRSQLDKMIRTIEKTIDKANARIAALSKSGQEEFAEKFKAIYENLAKVRHLPADSEEALAAIEEWYLFLNKMGDYSLEAFKNLGEMYVDDPRFTENIDKFGEGLAKFMRDAMAVYADRNK
ncbi:MAG: MerR family transcriptional regulator [Firmicutes bacterium]|nr:MerR family transcriptional regulator [Bacillota bacterium]